MHFYCASNGGLSLLQQICGKRCDEQATWFCWSTRLLPEACGWSTAFYKHFMMRRAACVPFPPAPRTVSSNDRLQSCASWPQLRTIDASGPFSARLGCKMNCSFFTETATVVAPMDCFFVQRQRQGACCRELWTDILCRWRLDSLRTNARRISLALSRRRTTRREYIELFNVVCACGCSLYW